MAILDNIVLNGTSYSIGASDSVVTHDPTYYGLDLENNVLGDNKWIRMALFPCANFTDSTLTYISPDYGVPYNTTLTIERLGERRYNATLVTRGKIIYVGITAYRVVQFHLEAVTDLTPSTATCRWRLYIPYHKPNDSFKIFADVPLDEITPSFIAKIYSIPQGLKKLNGKKWLALGDSYTAKIGNMWSTVASENGMQLANYGVSSSTIRVSSGDGDYAYRPMSERVDTMISEHSEEADDIGLITFMGGINDGWSAQKMGTLASTELTTIYGGCHHIFNSLLEAFPKALIVVILQPVCDTSSATEGGFDAEQNSIYAAQFKQRAVKEVAEFYGLHICDCCFNWYTTANPNDLSRYWQSDKLHLTTLGNAKLTSKMIKCVEDALID